MRKYLVLLCLVGCTSPEHWRAAFSSFEVGAYQGRSSTDGALRVGKEFDQDSESYGFFGSLHPFQYWQMQMQAEATARAITEAQYHAMLRARCEGKDK